MWEVTWAVTECGATRQLAVMECGAARQLAVHFVTNQFTAFVQAEQEVSPWYQNVASFLALIRSNQPQTHSTSISPIFSPISFCGFARPCRRSVAKMPINKRSRNKEGGKYRCTKQLILSYPLPMVTAGCQQFYRLWSEVVEIWLLHSIADRIPMAAASNEFILPIPPLNFCSSR